MTVFGLGRVGLVTAACFAMKGFQVVGIDTDPQMVRLIRDARPPFYEPWLNGYLLETIGKQTLRIADNPRECAESDVIFVTVGTPSAEDGSIDLDQVKSAATAIGQSIRESISIQTVVIKSTVVPGIARTVIKPILENESRKSAGTGFGLVSSPEFLRTGNAVRDTEVPHLLVFGGEDAKAMDRLEVLCREFYGTRLPQIIRTTHENAELIKYANNAYQATRISFINTIAAIAERIDKADVSAISMAVGLGTRAGSTFVRAGLGYGGPCLPKDLKAFVHFSRTLGYEPELFNAVSEVNRRQPLKAVEFAESVFGSIQSRRVAILGLASKPQTNEMRDAVSIQIIRLLLQKGAEVTAYDPVANEAARKVLQDQIQYADDARQCVKDADLAILVTEWDEFRSLTPSDILTLMKTPVVFDGRRVFDGSKMRAAGIRFSAIGLGTS